MNIHVRAWGWGLIIWSAGFYLVFESWWFLIATGLAIFCVITNEMEPSGFLDEMKGKNSKEKRE